MWINRLVLAHMENQIGYLRERIAIGDVEQGRTRGLLVQALNELGELRERLIAAEGDKRGAQSRADLLTVRVNQLQIERDQLFTRVMDPSHKIAILTPQVGMAPHLVPPGTDFEDIGDPAARVEGYPVPDALTREEEITGAVGSVFHPSGEPLQEAGGE